MAANDMPYDMAKVVLLGHKSHTFGQLSGRFVT